MKNKILLFAGLVVAVGLLFSSCKKDNTDLYAIDSEIAQNTLLGYYIFIDVDSAAMSTTLHEWYLAVDSLQNRVGYYRVASTGNGKDDDTTTKLTWKEPTMSEDKLSMSIPVTVGKKEKVLVWHDGVVTVDGYTTEKDLISVADVLRAVNENLLKFDFVYDDTTSYITSRKDTTYFLGWKTEVVYWPQDSIDAYKQFLIANADTLKWFNETYPTKAVPDTVRFAANPQTSGKYKDLYKGLIPRSFNTFEEKTIKTNHGPLHILNSEIVFNRKGSENTGLYTFYEKTWTEECYTKPKDKKAEQTDYTYTITDAKWTPIAFTNVKKFTVLFKGKMHMTMESYIGGKKQPVTTMDEKDYFFELPLSGFNKEDGEVTSNEHKYKNK